MATAAAATAAKTALTTGKITIPPIVKTILWIVGVVLIIIVGIIAFVKVKKWIKQRKDRKYVSLKDDGGQVEKDFDAGYYAGVMYSAMDGVTQTSTEKDNAAALLMKLNDNELISVHNHWNDNGSYYDRYGETLYEMMVNEWYQGGTNWDNLKNRLANLKLVTKD